MKKAPTSCWQDIGAKETDDRLFGAVPFLICRKLKKGASLLAVEYQQIGAQNFGYLFSETWRPFCGKWRIQKGHRQISPQTGWKRGFKSSRFAPNPVLHLWFDRLIFDTEKVRKHLMPCGFIRMASKVFGLDGGNARARTVDLLRVKQAL